MIRYAITDRKLLPGDEADRWRELLSKAARWSEEGVEIIQLREKDLPAGELASLGKLLMEAIGGSCKLLINSRADVAAAIGANGVHLTSARGELTPAQVLVVYAASGRPRPLVSVSAHSIDDVIAAARGGADYVLFGPVFGKRVAGIPVSPATGLDRLQQACAVAGAVPVLALGGVGDAETGSCMEAGAAGVAGIRLFL